MDVGEIDAILGRIEEGMREARAAVEVLRDGDASAMGELDETVDALATEVADLKGHTSRGAMG